MTGNLPRYPTILFDWGDTVMRDDPAKAAPMIEWETVEAVEHIEEVLAYLQSSGRRMILATSASLSDERQIRAALARCGLDIYFSEIYCFKNTNLPKSEAFYRRILDELAIAASDALMVGDSFENDVQTPNRLGMSAVWFNPGSDEERSGKLYTTVHSMLELRQFFESLDQRE
jgi:FMN phosphatase YigB (HAD superfamily)